MRRKDYRVAQSLQMCNGYANVRAGSSFSSVQYTDLLSADSYMDPKYTYPVLNRPKPVPVVPQFVEYDKQCLTYLATFHQTVAIYPEEMNRRRNVKLFYFLEDDTISVMEGRERVVRRGRHKKVAVTDVNYHWKDLNLGKEITLNGIRFQIYDCDRFTRDFMTSKGIQFESNRIEDQLKESLTIGPVQVGTRVEPERKADKLRRFLDFNGQVLR